MNTHRVRSPATRSTTVLVAGAVVLLTSMVLFDWFRVDVPGVGGNNALQAFDLLDLWLLGTAAAALTLACSGSSYRPGLATLVTGLAVTSMGLIAFVALFPPQLAGAEIASAKGIEAVAPTSRGPGVWLGGLATTVLAFAGRARMSRHGATFSSEWRRLTGIPGQKAV